ncbi:hypothetical protein DFH09DRAFT_1319164 [Mycena vulgaris]|nr:hypothetical protein DFH09DRAFT_1319164 [Mycena vulgaris]
MSTLIRRDRLAPICRIRPHYPAQYDVLLHLGLGAYEREDAGRVYFNFRGGDDTTMDALINGTLGQAAPNGLDVKAGSSVDLCTRALQYRRCKRLPRVIRFWASCPAPACRVTERLIHLHLIERGASLPRTRCSGCLKYHREYFSLSAAGGLEGFKEIVRMTFEDLVSEFPDLEFTFNWVPFVGVQS